MRTYVGETPEGVAAGRRELEGLGLLKGGADGRLDTGGGGDIRPPSMLSLTGGRGSGG